MQPEKRKFDDESASSMSAIQGAGLSRQQNLSNIPDRIVRHVLMGYLNGGERTDLMTIYRGEKKDDERPTVQDFIQKIELGMDIRNQCVAIVNQWITEYESLPADAFQYVSPADMFLEHPVHGRIERDNSYQNRVRLAKETFDWLLAHKWEIYDYQEPIAPKGREWTANEIKHNKERKDALFHAQMIDGFFARLNPNTNLVWPKVYENQPDVLFQGPELLEGGNWWLELFVNRGFAERKEKLYTWRRLLLQGKLSIANLRRPSTEWPRYKYNELIKKRPPVDYVEEIMEYSNDEDGWSRIDEAVDSGVIDLSAMRHPDTDVTHCEMILSLIRFLETSNRVTDEDRLKLKSISHILRQPGDIYKDFSEYEKAMHFDPPVDFEQLSADVINDYVQTTEDARARAIMGFWEPHIYILANLPDPDPDPSSSSSSAAAAASSTAAAAAMVDVAENQPGTKGWHIFPVDRRR